SGEKLVVAPGRFHDVKESSAANGTTDSEHSDLLIPLGTADQVTALELKLSAAAAKEPLRVLINGSVYYEGTPAQSNLPPSFDLTGCDLGRQLDLRVEGTSGGLRGAIEQATVRRTLTSARKSGFNNLVTTRFETLGDWHMQDSVLFGEILNNL